MALNVSILDINATTALPFDGMYYDDCSGNQPQDDSIYAFYGLQGNDLCRERRFSLPPLLFGYMSCAMCLQFITGSKMKHHTQGNITYVKDCNNPDVLMIPDPYNETMAELTCKVHPEDCQSWKICCQNAVKCCEQQIADGPRPFQEYGKTLCPRTWDGYMCWKDTTAGIMKAECPIYAYEHDPTNPGPVYAYKTCTQNVTWWRHPGSNNEWTDYRQCTTIDHYYQLHHAEVACNIISIILLVPACIIFCYFKQLRQQHRIRLHLCLMLSVLVYSVMVVLWQFVIYRDILDNYGGTLSQNTIGCRVLNVVKRYALMAMYMWMFIEGFHLHRLLVQAFSTPKTLIPYYAVGFGFPLIPSTAYIIIRSVVEGLNEKCWVHHAGGFEWIVYTPIMAVQLTNVFFLLRIVFIMVKQLAPHPNEPSNFRRALKAVGVLVPLFGVQYILFVYRPPEKSTFTHYFELVSMIVSGLQGALIAILFCYVNTEVQGHLKTAFLRVLRSGGYRGRDISMRGGSMTMTSHFSADTTRSRFANGNGDASHNMIPLQRISDHYDADIDAAPLNGSQNMKIGGTSEQGSQEYKMSLLDKTAPNA